MLLLEIWCNRHNVKQMNQRDAWDIISIFNNNISETLNKLVAIHLEDTNHLVVDVREFPINHLILQLNEISPADMSGHGYISSDSVVTNLGQNYPRHTRRSNQNVNEGELNFQSLTIGWPTGTNPSPYIGMAKINNLDKTWAEVFKPNFMNAILKIERVIIYIHDSKYLERHFIRWGNQGKK